MAGAPWHVIVVALVDARSPRPRAPAAAYPGAAATPAARTPRIACIAIDARPRACARVVPLRPSGRTAAE
jgi:hypothetical protein